MSVELSRWNVDGQWSSGKMGDLATSGLAEDHLLVMGAVKPPEELRMGLAPARAGLKARSFTNRYFLVLRELTKTWRI